MQCILGKHEPSKIDKEQVKRDGWIRQKILVISADDHRLDWVEREFIKQIGDKIYGKNK